MRYLIVRIIVSEHFRRDITLAPHSRLRRPPALYGRFWRRGVLPFAAVSAPCAGGCDGVLGGQAVQYVAVVFVGDGAAPKMLVISSIRTA